MAKSRNLDIFPQPHITTVLFDLDDTLIDSFRAREDSLMLVLKSAGITIDDSWSLANFRGSEIKDILRQNGIKEDEVEKCFLFYRRIYWTKDHAQVELYRGVRPLLTKLRERGIKMGVVTQKGRDFLIEGYRAGAAVELQKVNILDLFEVVVGLEDVRKTKPDPEGICLALTKLHSTPEVTLFVGDSFADISAAKEAGCWSCYARWGITNSKDLNADYIAMSPQQLLTIVIPHPRQ